MRALALIIAFLTACQLPAPSAPTTPVSAVRSTFKVDTVLGSGTGWIHSNHDGVSWLITANHVCVQPRVTLIGPDGVSHFATVVKESDTRFDLCELRADEVLGPAMDIAPADPEYGDAVAYVGAPMGVFGCQSSYRENEYCGLAPISRGWYAGGDLVSMPATGGSSGSAVFTSRGVIGVLVAGYRVYDDLTFIESRSHLVTFLGDTE